MEVPEQIIEELVRKPLDPGNFSQVLAKNNAALFDKLQLVVPRDKLKFVGQSRDKLKFVGH